MSAVLLSELSDHEKEALIGLSRALEVQDELALDFFEKLQALALAVGYLLRIDAGAATVQLSGYDLHVVGFCGCSSSLQEALISGSTTPFRVICFHSRLQALDVRESKLHDAGFLVELQELRSLRLTNVRFIEKSSFCANRLVRIHLDCVANCNITVPSTASLQHFYCRKTALQEFKVQINLKHIELHDTDLALVDLRESIGLKVANFSEMKTFSHALIYFHAALEFLDVSQSSILFLDLQNLALLRYLDISCNEKLYLMNDYIPQALQELRAQGRFERQVFLDYIHNLQLADLAGNAEWARKLWLGEIQHLDVSDCALELLDLRSAKSLRFLDVSDNPQLDLVDYFVPPLLETFIARRRSAVYAHVTECAELHVFDATDNYEMRFIYAYFPESLQELRLAGCKLLHVDVSTIKQLRVLDLAFCEFEDVLWGDAGFPQTVLTASSSLSAGQARRAVETYWKLIGFLVSLY